MPRKKKNERKKKVLEVDDEMIQKAKNLSDFATDVKDLAGKYEITPLEFLGVMELLKREITDMLISIRYSKNRTNEIIEVIKKQMQQQEQKTSNGSNSAYI